MWNWITGAVIGGTGALMLWWWLRGRHGHHELAAADRVPAWAAFMSPMEFRAWMDVLEQTLAEEGLTATQADGIVAALLPDGQPVQIGLRSLAQRCSQQDHRRWAATIRRHIDQLAEAERITRNFDRLDFSQVADRLKVRIYPEEALAAAEEIDVIRRPLAEGLAAVLVYDLPSAVSSVEPEDLTPWPEGEEQLFVRAEANLRAHRPGKRKDVEADKGVIIRRVEGESFFVASELMLLDRQLPQKLPYGALVCAPTANVLLLHSIRDARVLVAINAMIPEAFVRFQAGPASLSPNLYWWHDDKLTLLPSEVLRASIKFTPPDAFVTHVINPLGAK